MSASRKKRTSTVVIKPQTDLDAYVLWDGVREEPFWFGTRAELSVRLAESSRKTDIIDAVERVVARTDENGTSLHYPSRTGEFLYGWHEDFLLFRSRYFVSRSNLVELTRRVIDELTFEDLTDGLTEVGA